MQRKKLLNIKMAKIISKLLAKNISNIHLKEKLINFFTNEALEEKEIFEILQEVSKSYESDLDQEVKFRILSPLETKNLTDEALNYLLILKEENRINEEIFEETLLDISKIYGTIDLPILKKLLKTIEMDKKRIIN